MNFLKHDLPKFGIDSFKLFTLHNDTSLVSNIGKNQISNQDKKTPILA